MKHHFSLKNYNTFSVDVNARYFLEVKSQEELLSAIKKNHLPIYVIGSGSNILFTKDIKGLVIRSNIMGKKIVHNDKDAVLVEVGSGENWHDFVSWSVDKGFYGLENLSLIWGTVGASPIQNIGAYGVELKDVFHSLKAINIESFKEEIFNKKDCQFGYRDSIFKNELKNKYFIVSVTFKLEKKGSLKLTYGNIKEFLSKKNIRKPTLKDVRDTIMEIRETKLPNPLKLSNCGSFFKNPIINREHIERLQKKFPDLKYFEVGDFQYKIPAAWLIEKTGWKGKRLMNTGCYSKHALIIVNYGNATGEEILEFSIKIQEAVFEKFGIYLEREVTLW